MTGDTHRAGGMLVSIIGFSMLKSHGLLLEGVNPCLQWLVIYPFCMWGSVASDLDHHSDSIPEKDYPSVLINKALHITKPIEKSLDETLSAREKSNSLVYKLAKLGNAHHRSWQTHSDLTLFVMLIILRNILSGRFSQFGAVDTAIASLVMIGLCLGVVAHLVLDILTPEGIHLVLFEVLNLVLKKLNSRLRLPEKLHLVPKKAFFATSGKWEEFCNLVLKIGTYIAVGYFLLMLVFPYIQAIIPFSVEYVNN